MRGMKTIGLLFLLAAILGSLLPSPVMAQGADSQYLTAGNQLYTAKNYAQAAKYYNAALKLNPNNPAAWQGMGNCYYALNDKKDALTCYQRASALQPSNTQLAQFVQTLQTQLGGGTAPAPAPGAATAPATSSYYTQGVALFNQRQYARSLPYFQYAIRQNPSDFKPYLYAGYAYYYSRDFKDAALYLEIAAAKSGNASTKNTADNLKASLPPDQQQWVDDTSGKYLQGAGGATTATANAGGTSFGFHILGGVEYVLADPTSIEDKVKAAGSVSLTGTTPNVIGLPELEPFVQLGPNFEINLAIGYFPVGNLAYTTTENNPTYENNPNYTGPIQNPDVWRYTFTTNIVTVDLGLKLLFGDKSVKGYLGLGGGISPVSVNFNKTQYDSTGTTPLGTASSAGTYNTMAINGQAILGVDFSLGNGLALGPYVGYRYLNATNFQKGGSTLQVDQNTGAVGIPGQDANFPSSDPASALTLDFSGIEGGLNLTLSF